MSFSKFTPLGFYIGHEVEENTLTIRTQSQSHERPQINFIHISVVGPGTVNVKVVRYGDTITDFSYAAQGNEKWPFEVEEDSNSIYFHTEFIRGQIRKRPLQLIFQSQQGAPLLMDDTSFVAGWIGDEVTAYKTLQPHEHFLGLGDKTGFLDKLNSQFVNWNTDADTYGQESDPLHASIPFYMGVTGHGSYGVFLDNTSKTSFNFGATDNRFVTFKAESGTLNYYFFHAPEMAGVVKAYTDLTGRMEMPPLWSLGYQQYPHHNENDKDILRLAQTFRDKGIPCDVLHLDMHYMQDNKVFTWDNGRYGNPHEVIIKLKEMGFRVVLSLHPAIKIDSEYDIYNKGIKAGIFLKYPNKDLLQGEGASGWSHFPDFTAGTDRQWWGELFNELVEYGVQGYWCEKNEPWVKGGNLPDIVGIDYDGQNTTYKTGHNVYGMQMARATYEGLKDRENAKRPFVLTRTGYAGVQRYAALWVGNNTSDPENLLLGVRMVSGMGVSGQAFSGLDMGGIDGNMSPELYARWMQVGAFMPFFRGHAAVNNGDVEAWSFGKETEEISRSYMRLRYRLLPFTYSLFYEAAQTGMPLVRTLAFYHSRDRDTKIYDYDYQNQFYYGAAYMVCPVLPGSDHANVYIPYGEFYDVYNDEKITSTGIEIVVPLTRDRLPIYARAGAIVTRQQATQHTGETTPWLELHIYKGAYENTLEYYEDDGETYHYKEGAYYKRNIVYRPQTKTLTLEKKKGSYTSKYTWIQLYFHGYKADDLKPSINGIRTNVETVDTHFTDPISNFEPAYKRPNPDKHITQLPFIELDNEDKEIIISF